MSARVSGSMHLRREACSRRRARRDAVGVCRGDGTQERCARYSHALWDIPARAPRCRVRIVKATAASILDLQPAAIAAGYRFRHRTPFHSDFLRLFEKGRGKREGRSKARSGERRLLLVDTSMPF